MIHEDPLMVILQMVDQGSLDDTYHFINEVTTKKVYLNIMDDQVDQQDIKIYLMVLQLHHIYILYH
jgi:hypothetical protein